MLTQTLSTKSLSMFLTCIIGIEVFFDVNNCVAPSYLTYLGLLDRAVVCAQVDWLSVWAVWAVLAVLASHHVIGVEG